MNSKKQHGQYYTLRSPFTHTLFQEWLNSIPNINEKQLWEPFGGANNIIKMVQDSTDLLKVSQWISHDIEPEAVHDNQVLEIELVKNNSIKNPIKTDIIITNPPYLAKNSAKRMKMNVEFGNFTDLWEISINMMLSHADYVAAIIPESFITRNLFQERLFGVISITDSLFDDTGFPVCLALWVKEPQKDFTVYVGNNKVGSFSKIKQNTVLFNTTINKNVTVKYNVPSGSVGLRAVDNLQEASIKYVVGDDIPANTVKNTSRALTRISITDNNSNDLINDSNVNEFIDSCNKILNDYRLTTGDIFLTSFKCLRKDNVYRRRLDWKTSTLIIHKAIEELNLLN